MPQEVRQLRLFVAAPEDVQEELKRLRGVVQELNQPGGVAEQHNCVLQVLDWQQVIPGMGQPEELILNQLQLESWDIFLGMAWMRFSGSSTTRPQQSSNASTSDMERDFRLAYRAFQDSGRPHIMFYHCKRSYPPDLLTTLEGFEQLQKVSS